MAYNFIRIVVEFSLVILSVHHYSSTIMIYSWIFCRWDRSQCCDVPFVYICGNQYCKRYLPCLASETHFVVAPCGQSPTPCRNLGFCEPSSNSRGYTCDCSFTGFVGINCQSRETCKFPLLNRKRFTTHIVSIWTPTSSRLTAKGLHDSCFLLLHYTFCTKLQIV